MADVAIRCKGVHVKLDRETHANFKIQLIKHGVSMQDAFAEFARLVGEENPSACKLITRFVRDRIKIELASVGLKMKPGETPKRLVNELDNERLYDLINDDWKDDDEDADEVPVGDGGRDEAA